ncbi:organic cation transporter 1 [Caerostris darwini]|uniref:Organic cation transporter 1 n=1 Tax=Caerostris darwini TaxID=1538125 RepID=A0AAV4RG99_9ARAC|nr:organic cation transporter 1 [Caerostris darwini]
MEFENILQDAGEFGKYQKSLLIKFMAPTTFASAFYVLNVIFMVATPDHRCYVPELASLNLSESEIRNIAIPKLNDGSFSKCTMYSQNYSALVSEFKSSGKFPEIKTIGKIISKRPENKCNHGWVYQKEWYEETIVSKWDLVCDNNYLPSLVLTLANAGSVFGTFCFSIIADKEGRRTAFFINLCVALISGVLSIFSPTFAIFAIFRMLTGATMPSNFQVPYIITVEQVGSKQRSWLVCISWTLWTLGSCCLAFTAYLTRHWTTLGLVTTLPIAAFFSYKSYLKPSPRYLMAQGRCEEATEVIQTIAKINERKVPKGLLSRLKAITENERKEGEVDSNISVFTFFKYPQLRKKLFIVTLNWTAIAIAYFGLTLNATNLGSNDFLNFFLLSSVELPAFPLALLLMEKLGRRWSCTIFVLLTGIACLVPSFLAKDMGSVAIIASMIGKFGSAASFMVIYQQAAELYPTPIRALGMGIGSVVSSLAVICMPYVCYLGIYNKAIPFLIIGAMCVVAGLTAPLVPETLHQQLPQTIKGSEEFGTGRGCFPCCASAERKDDDPENPEGA